MSFADIEARVLAHYEKSIGQAVMHALTLQGTGQVAAVKVALVHDEVVVKCITFEEFYK
jgi:hypothetical protein